MYSRLPLSPKQLTLITSPNWGWTRSRFIFFPSSYWWLYKDFLVLDVTSGWKSWRISIIFLKNIFFKLTTLTAGLLTIMLNICIYSEDTISQICIPFTIFRDVNTGLWKANDHNVKEPQCIGNSIAQKHYISFHTLQFSG